MGGISCIRYCCNIPEAEFFLKGSDPFNGQAPGSLQSYNRYSYVWNNPFAGTDPGGYEVYRPEPRPDTLDEVEVTADRIERPAAFDLPNRQDIGAPYLSTGGGASRTFVNLSSSNQYLQPVIWNIGATNLNCLLPGCGSTMMPGLGNGLAACKGKGGKFSTGETTEAYGYLFNRRVKDEKDESDLKLTYGLQGGVRMGITKLLGLKIDIDGGSRELSLITGKQFVNENYTMSVDVAGYSFGLDASRNAEISNFVYGQDSISEILSVQPIVVSPIVQAPWGLSAREFWKVDFGVSFGLGLEGTLDFTNLIGQ